MRHCWANGTTKWEITSFRTLLGKVFGDFMLSCFFFQFLHFDFSEFIAANTDCSSDVVVPFFIFMNSKMDWKFNFSRDIASQLMVWFNFVFCVFSMWATIYHVPFHNVSNLVEQQWSIKKRQHKVRVWSRCYWRLDLNIKTRFMAVIGS